MNLRLLAESPDYKKITIKTFHFHYQKDILQDNRLI